MYTICIMITLEQVESAQSTWGAGVVKIGSLKQVRTECEQFTSDFLDQQYGFDDGVVLFKPTRCAIEQFRSCKKQATSYFIAGSECKCEEDTGFALQPWTKVRFENTGVILEEARAIAMGNYYFTDLDGNDTKVEYTFAYKVVEGALKIDLHHSSLPYNPAA